MAKSPYGGNSGEDDLISGNYLQQPSPFSWAQNYGQHNPLYAQMTNDLLKTNMGKEADAARQRERLTADADLQTKLQELRGKQQIDLANTKDENKDATFEMGEKGEMTVPESVYRSMPPSSQRRMNHTRTIVKNGKNYMVLTPKDAGGGAAAPAANQYDQYTK